MKKNLTVISDRLLAAEPVGSALQLPEWSVSGRAVASTTAPDPCSGERVPGNGG
jgi:hypothetical protein